MPPVGGPHNPVQLNCGIYNVPVPNENAVHSLEHGAVWITYQPNLPPDQLATLQQIVSTHYVGTERYLLLSPYAGIPAPIVASAWGYQLSVDQASDPRLVQFITQFAGGGQGGEKGGPCTGGIGSPLYRGRFSIWPAGRTIAANVTDSVVTYVVAGSVSPPVVRAAVQKAFEPTNADGSLATTRSYGGLGHVPSPKA